MSVVVRMEMPLNCERCPMCGTESGGNGLYKLWCMCGDILASSRRRPDDCHIICALPEGHGRLVDADALKDYLIAEAASYDLTQGQMGILSEAIDMIDEQPTIVPAERSET